MYQLSLLYLDRENNFLCLYIFSILHACFTSLVQLSLIPDTGRDTLTLGLIYNSRVYSLQIDIKTCFTCIFFDPTSSLHKSILVESKTGHRKRHSNTCPAMYQSSLLSLQREKNLLRLSIFRAYILVYPDPTSSLCESILLESKTGTKKRHSNAWPNQQHQLAE